jgi:hypothetical protein
MTTRLIRVIKAGLMVPALAAPAPALAQDDDGDSFGVLIGAVRPTMFTLYSIVYSDEKVNTPRFGGDIGVGLKRPRRPDHPRTKYFMPELHYSSFGSNYTPTSSYADSPPGEWKQPAITLPLLFRTDLGASGLRPVSTAATTTAAPVDDCVQPHEQIIGGAVPVQAAPEPEPEPEAAPQAQFQPYFIWGPQLGFALKRVVTASQTTVICDYVYSYYSSFGSERQYCVTFDVGSEYAVRGYLPPIDIGFTFGLGVEIPTAFGDADISLRYYQGVMPQFTYEIIYFNRQVGLFGGFYF